MQSFVIIGRPVPEKNIFECFFTIYGHGGHLGHVTWTIYSDAPASLLWWKVVKSVLLYSALLYIDSDALASLLW